MKRKIVIMALMFFVLVSCSYAVEDFAASAKSALEICQCKKTIDSITIKNTGTSASSYSIFVDKDFSSLVEVPAKFTLKPGQAATAGIYINAPCNSAGKSPFIAYIKTSSGLIKGVKQTLDFVSCSNYSLSSGQIYDLKGDEVRIEFSKYEGTYSLCAGKKAAIPLLIKNNAPSENQYSFSIIGPAFASLSASQASLKPNKQGAILLNLNPDDDNIGENKLRVTSKIAGSEETRTLELDVKIEKCYGITAEFSQDAGSICGCEQAKYPITITHEGKFTEDIIFNLSGAGWLNYDVNSSTFLSGEKKGIELIASPPCDASGDYDVRFTALGTAVNASDEMILSVTPFSDCYKADILSDYKIESDYSGGKNLAFWPLTSPRKRYAI